MDSDHTSAHLILLAGATGDLGFRVAQHLRSAGIRIRVLARRQSPHGYRLDALRAAGADVRVLNFNDPAMTAAACADGTCLVSTLSGLEDVIIGLQERLLSAALEAGVPRFIASDFCIDYTRIPAGGNRNLDLRRRFAQILDASPVRATGILNGMFTELLLSDAPLIQQRLQRIIHWGDRDQPMDFTTRGDTAGFTVRAVLDAESPRYLRIAGDVQSIAGLAAIASTVHGKPFRPLRLGSLRFMQGLIKLTRSLSFTEAVFPAWQGMQYLHDMLEGSVKLSPLDNDRYGRIPWKKVGDVLQSGVRP